MASKPRSSLLDLFDPLLADAVRVPIPESPPMTPQKPPEGSVENKENRAPNELTMSVFFNRISRNTNSPNVKATDLFSGPLVDLEDTENWSDGRVRAQASPRVPLTELSVDDFPLPINSSFDSASPNIKTISQGHLSFSGPMPLAPSPLRQTQLASSPLPAMSLDVSCHLQGSLMHTTHSPINSDVLSQNIERPRESMQSGSSKGLLHPDNHVDLPRKQFRRRSSVDISTTVSSLSSNSFHLPDASFDLVNGEISFLTKSSEQFDMDHDIEGDSREPQTPNASPQTLVPEESPLDLSKTIRNSSNDILATSTSTQPPIGHVDTPSETQVANVALDNIKTGAQDTPPSARRFSSVPAPMKKHRVFTSKHHQTSNAVSKRGSAAMVATSSGIHPTSKLSLQEPAVVCGMSSNSGIPRGTTAKGPATGDTVEQHKGKPAVSGVRAKMTVPSRTVRSLGTSVLHKGESAERSLNTSMLSRLPGPAGVRSEMGAKQGRCGQPEPTQRGRSIPVRSKVRLGTS